MQDKVDQLLATCAELRETDSWERLRTVAAEALSLAESIGYKPGIAGSLAYQAYALYILSDFQPAIPLAVRALQIAEESGARIAESYACIVLALVYWSLGDYESAVRFVERARVTAEAVGDRMMIGFSSLIRGSILQGFGDHDEALRWVTRGYEIFTQDNHTIGRARALAGLGGLHRQMGRKQEALDAMSQALQLAEQAGNQLSVSRALNDLGGVYRDLDRPADALDCYTRALEIRRRDGYRSAEITTLLDLAEFYRQSGDEEAAIRDASAGLALAAEIGVKPKLSQAHRLLADLFEAAGRFRQAVIHLKEHQAVHASISQEQAAAMLKTSELMSSLERLRMEQASVVETEKREALANLAGALAHEINSPLGALTSSSDSTIRCVDRLVTALNGNGQKPGIGELLEILKNNADVLGGATRRVQSVFERFRNFSKWEDQLCREVDLIESVETALTFLAPRAEISIRRDFQPLPKICGHTAELNQIFLQLLSNAEQSITGSGEIRVASRVDGDRLAIEIADTGRGIEPERLAKLFEPGFSLGGPRVKASFSLFACQHVVRRHGGEIRVSSQPGQGSSFTVILPRGASAHHA